MQLNDSNKISLDYIITYTIVVIYKISLNDIYKVFGGSIVEYQVASKTVT